MKRFFRIFTNVVLTASVLVPATLLAGNKDRAGQPGAAQLLINPWAKSAGWANTNTACTRGLESIYTNVAGIAFTKKTEVVFSHVNYLQGAGVNVNAFGLTQRIGAEGAGGVIGLSFMNISMGDVEITTTDAPEGGLGKFSPKLMNINLSYAKAFSKSIYGGVNFKVLSESINDVTGQGVAIDAGIQYVTGEDENIKFGIALKNIGAPMKYSGDGFSFRGVVPGSPNAMTLSQRSSQFELPSLLNIGVSYDFLSKDRDPKNDKIAKYRVTPAGNFCSNAFGKDIFTGGLEFAIKEMFMLRAGYSYEEGIGSREKRTNIYTGPAMGFTIKLPLNKAEGSYFDLDYSYRPTDPFGGCHAIGARINL